MQNVVNSSRREWRNNAPQQHTWLGPYLHIFSGLMPALVDCLSVTGEALRCKAGSHAGRATKTLRTILQKRHSQADLRSADICAGQVAQDVLQQVVIQMALPVLRLRHMRHAAASTAASACTTTYSGTHKRTSKTP